MVGAIFLLSSNANKTTTNNQTTAPTTQTQTQTTATPTMQENTASEAAVTLTANGFNPQTVTVKAGTKVVWTNKSGMTGNVSSNPHPTHTAYPPLNLGNFDNNQSISLVFDKAGTYGYHDHLDASLTGTVVVTP